MAALSLIPNMITLREILWCLLGAFLVILIGEESFGSCRGVLAADIIVNPPDVLTSDFVLKSVTDYMNSPEDGSLPYKIKDLKITQIAGWREFVWQGVPSWCSPVQFTMQVEDTTLLCSTVMIYSKDKGVKFERLETFNQTIKEPAFPQP